MLKKSSWNKSDLYIGFGFLFVFFGLVRIFPNLNNLDVAIPLFLGISVVLLIASLILRRILIFIGYFFGYFVIALIVDLIGFKFFWKY
jgi:hypothetical protein